LIKRVVCWFSCGDASAVATAMAIKKYLGRINLVVARIRIENEHPDNDRFAEDCSQWFGVPIINLASTKFKDAWDVWETKRFISGVNGAPCTTELKKAVRLEFQRAYDLQIFGYTQEEREREQPFSKRTISIST